MSSIDHLRAALSDTVLSLFHRIALQDGDGTADLSDCPIETLLDARQCILELIACDLAPVFQAANARKDPMQRLQPELLAEIFTRLGTGDRFTASYVCRHWRRVALAHPAVWADMTGFGSSNPRLPLALQRAAACPIDLSFNLYAWQREVVARRTGAALKLSLPSMRSLGIFVDPLKSFAFLPDALDAPAPLLERLQILTIGSGQRDANNVVELRADTFQDSAPRLSYLRCVSVFFPRAPIRAFATVRELHLTPMREDDMWRILCEHTLTAMPDLEILHLSLPSGVDQSTSPVSSLVVPPFTRLRDLRVWGNAASKVLLAFPHRQCNRVILNDAEGEVPLEAFLAPISSVKYLALWGDFCALADAQRLFGRIAKFRRSSIPTSIFTPSVTNQLQVLVLRDVDEIPWSSKVLLPRLIYLELVLALDFGDSASEGFPGELRLVAPALRVLRLARTPTRHLHTAEWDSAACEAFMDVLSPDRDVWLELDGLHVPDIPRTVRRPMTSVASTFSAYSPDAKEEELAWAALSRISDAALSALQTEE
ncbi:hypothetical protein EXIGLDRAFT_838622 [Exidia glandulosa HHB12029]|uniref:F-box domain-containing protein n=1 Tax=Exidia glandulosa HHB12029 TaxID=1314781 RepID=A0A165FN15_EXIGL|nr:hypothetical protein EXIGLDRAFT_838622 [Exidia glandulosa HHB12029]